MFIYKITDTRNQLCYIGFDTHSEHYQHRWQVHQKNCGNNNTKFYKALIGNIEKFTYEIIDRADTILDLAFREIYWIDHFNSYRDGYNSTRGGDGLNQDLTQFSESDILQLKQLYSISMSAFNNDVKWKNKTHEERREMTKHLHTAEVYDKKSETLKQFYEKNPSVKAEKGRIIKEWQSNNKDRMSETNRQNGLSGSKKVSKKVKIEFQNGDIKIYNSKSEFNREHGEIVNAVIKKTKDGESHRGLKGWEI